MSYRVSVNAPGPVRHIHPSGHVAVGSRSGFTRTPSIVRAPSFSRAPSVVHVPTHYHRPSVGIYPTPVYTPPFYTPPIYRSPTVYTSSAPLQSRRWSLCTSIGLAAVIMGIMLTVILGAAIGGAGVAIGVGLAFGGGIGLVFFPE